MEEGRHLENKRIAVSQKLFGRFYKNLCGGAYQDALAQGCAASGLRRHVGCPHDDTQI